MAASRLLVKLSDIPASGVKERVHHIWFPVRRVATAGIRKGGRTVVFCQILVLPIGANLRPVTVTPDGQRRHIIDSADIIKLVQERASKSPATSLGTGLVTKAE